MKWFVKCDVVDIPTEIHHTYQKALDSIRGKSGDGYYLDVKFKDTEEFIVWMNKKFLDTHDHGKCCKIFRTDSDYYWSHYLRSLGSDIMYALVKGIEEGSYSPYDNYVQYIDADCKFISFNDLQGYFASVYPLKDILEELTYRY